MFKYYTKLKIDFYILCISIPIDIKLLLPCHIN